MKSDDDHCRGEQSVQAAKEFLLCYLSGRSFDAGRMREAVELLANEAPDELAALRQAAALAASEPDDYCLAVRAALDDYLALGEQAAAELPEVHRHLHRCPICMRHLEVLKETDTASWLELSRKLSNRPTLVLIRNVWHLVAAGIKTALSDAAPGSLLDGGWRLRPALHGMNLGGPERIELEQALPGDAAVVIVAVDPDDTAAGASGLWQLTVGLKEARAGRFSVSLTSGTYVTGRRALSENCEVVFQVEPASTDCHILHFRWQEPDGTIQQHDLELHAAF